MAGAGLAVGPGRVDGAGTIPVLGVGAGLGLAPGEVEMTGGGAMSAITEAGASEIAAAVPKPRMATLRPRLRRRTTWRGKPTCLFKSLQLLRRCPLRVGGSNPKRLPPWAPSCPIRIRYLLSPLPQGQSLTLPYFHIFVTTYRIPPFHHSPPALAPA